MHVNDVMTNNTGQYAAWSAGQTARQKQFNKSTFMEDFIKTANNEHTLLVTTVPELEAAFRNVLSQLLDEREQERQAREQLRLATKLSRGATAKRLQKDLSTLYRWEQAGLLHPIRIGRSVFYLESEIQMIEEGRR